ncbi:MAG: hypothetical protein VCB43_07440 [Myxococcota bacterium]
MVLNADIGLQSLSKPWLIGCGFLAGLGVGFAALHMPNSESHRDQAAMKQSVAAALEIPSAFKRADLLYQTFSVLDAENVRGAEQAMRASAESLNAVDLQVFLSAWTEIDGLAAMSAASAWPSEAGRKVGMRIVMREWAASGHAIEAGDYYHTVQNVDAKSMLAGPLARGWALSGDVDGAQFRVRLMWEQGEPPNTVDGFVRGALHAEGAEALIERVVSLDPDQGGEFEQRLTRVALNLAARENPLAASQAYADLEKSLTSDWLHGALLNIARPWSETEPAAALEWLISRTPSPERTLALKEIIRGWAIVDLGAAWQWWSTRTDWPQALPGEEPSRSIVLTALLRRMAKVQPHEAARWVHEVEKAGPRQTLLLRIAHFWALRDATEAKNWIGDLTLPDDQAAQAMDAIGRASGNSP